MKSRTKLQKLLRLAHEETGAELVEFALSSLLLVTFLFGIFNWMLGMYVFHFTTYAAQQATRYAMVHGHTWSKNTSEPCSTSAPPNFVMSFNCEASTTDIQNYVQSLAGPGITPSGLTINTSSSSVWPGVTPDGTTAPCSAHANAKGCMVKIKVSYSFTFLPLMKLSALSMGATSEKVIVE
jgi:Flp pilus assembly protein TadG